MPATHWILTAFGRILPSPQWRMRSHRHDYAELIVIISGVLRVKEPDGTAYTGKTGDVFLYPAGRWHEEMSDKNNPVETLFFSFAGPTYPKITLVDDSDGRIRALSQWIWDSRRESFPQSARMNQAFFNAIHEEFTRLGQRPVQKTAAIGLRGFVLKNIGRKITLDELAANVNMSKFHFCRQYHKKNGKSPMADVRKIRIEEARSLLASTNLPLKAIAGMVGLSNEYQLAAAIRKHTGFPSGHFRKK